MPTEQIVWIALCLAGVSMMQWILAPILRVPRVFVFLLLGYVVAHLPATDFAQSILRVSSFHPAPDAVKLIGWLGILLMLALGSHPVEQRKSSESLSWRCVSFISVTGFGSTMVIASLCGYLLACYAPHFMGDAASYYSFALAVGLACSVTAFPVLVLMLHEINAHESAIGKLAIELAAMDDLWLWLCLVILLSTVDAASNPVTHIAGITGFLLATFFVLRPLIHYVLQKQIKNPNNNTIVIGVCVIIFMSIAGDFIGVHALFGAFLAGKIFPVSVLIRLQKSLLPFVQAVMVPFFFIVTGMNTDLPSAGYEFFYLVLLFISLGMIMKLLCVSCAARWSGMPWSSSFELGSLMQCKGLMEIVVLGIMLDSQIIGREVFSALVIMAVICTAMTLPLRSICRLASTNKRIYLH